MTIISDIDGKNIVWSERMCPSENEIFDSMLSGASEMAEEEKWYQTAWRVILGILLYIPHRLYDLLIRPIKRRRAR